MTAAEDETTGRTGGLPAPAIGERRRPANAGDLGYTYSIYRFYDLDDRLLYLGRSARVRQRIADLEVGHPRGLPLGHEDGPRPWWREAARVELQHLPPGTTDEEARAEERRQIETFHPIYNLEHNEVFFDRERLERAIDAAHFEVDVATAEHERHDGVVRPLDRIAAESEQMADRLRPGGSGRLRQGRRRPVVPADLRGGPGRKRAGDDGGGTDRRSSGTSSARGWSRSLFGDGPGSFIGLVVVVAILLAMGIAALVISLRVVL